MLVSVLCTALMAVQVPQDVSSQPLPSFAPAWTVSTDIDALGSKAGFEASLADSGYRFSVAAFGRISWPFGALDDNDAYLVGNVILIPDHLRYGDVFEPGWGYGLEASIMFESQPPPGARGGHSHGPGPYGGGLRAGVYVSLQTDTYEGGRESEGSASFEADDLTMVAGYIGLKISTNMGGGSFGDAHVGIGMVRYDAVDATVSLFGGGGSEQEFLQESQEFAFESRYRFSAKLGPVALFGGIGLRIMGSPDEGDSNVGDAFDAHAFWTFDLDFGVQLGF